MPRLSQEQFHAAELRAESVDIAIISKQIGHQSIATIARYLHDFIPMDVIKSVCKKN